MTADLNRSDRAAREWSAWAIRRVEADATRSADTHLLTVPLPREWNIHLYLKDESTHPTGSLKHRLARSLFLYALCNGWITRGTAIVEASSGSTAVSEAYFARLLGLPFFAVMPASTSPAKVALIEREGGTCHLVEDPAAIRAESVRLAEESGGHFLDQFTYAERATDWRGNNNIAESIFGQLAREPFPVPSWIVAGAGTGGTSATIGRFLRYRGHPTRLCVVDPDHSAFFPGWEHRDPGLRTATPSRIEGIGRQRVEPSFVPAVVDRMIHVPDAASIAAARFLRTTTGLSAGASTGTNLYGAYRILCEMRETGTEGSVVTLLCDRGDRYENTYYNDDWTAAQGLAVEPYLEILEAAHRHGKWTG
ncbi:PLP-dependent cysteine synthase family protein [Amycolatopsis jejuensis]|uniref:PLP-dependent cysteine synthase family protein n=1 Tax=Amycolatopsis jejuensis TaxID=330084 RepID=UPI000525E4DC|nr:PLP-dependent cysteine synthase family protein [Amycolatopsis jejuensis]